MKNNTVKTTKITKLVMAETYVSPANPGVRTWPAVTWKKGRVLATLKSRTTFYDLTTRDFITSNDRKIPKQYLKNVLSEQTVQTTATTRNLTFL